MREISNTCRSCGIKWAQDHGLCRSCSREERESRVNIARLREAEQMQPVVPRPPGRTFHVRDPLSGQGLICEVVWSGSVKS